MWKQLTVHLVNNFRLNFCHFNFKTYIYRHCNFGFNSSGPFALLNAHLHPHPSFPKARSFWKTRKVCVHNKTKGKKTQKVLMRIFDLFEVNKYVLNSKGAVSLKDNDWKGVFPLGLLFCAERWNQELQNEVTWLLILKVRRRSIRICRWPDARINESKILQGIRRIFLSEGCREG